MEKHSIQMIAELDQLIEAVKNGEEDAALDWLARLLELDAGLHMVLEGVKLLVLTMDRMETT